MVVCKRYHVIIEEFDSKGNSLGRARPFEVSEAELVALGKNQYDYEPDDLRWESRAVYDSKGRQTQTTDAYGQTTYYSYDSRGNLLTTVDPLGRVTTNKYDGGGRLAQTVDSNGNVSSYQYDKNGNITSMTTVGTDGEQQTRTTVEYNTDGKVTSMTDKDGGVTLYGYDEKGRQIFTKTTTKDALNPSATHVTASYTLAAGWFLKKFRRLSINRHQKVTIFQVKSLVFLVSSTIVRMRLFTKFSLRAIARQAPSCRPHCS